MFTGIITGLGQITSVQTLGDSVTHGKRLTILCPQDYLVDVVPGDSIALNGACMTATSVNQPQASFTVDISAESLDKTTGLDSPGIINLEKALRASDRLGGHLVSGHVDGIGEVQLFEPLGESWTLKVRTPAGLGRYLAYKGSITVNGVSLTVNQVQDDAAACLVSINLIPHTLQNTALGQLRQGSRVNLEIDLIARYVERMLGTLHAQPARP
jgi:riboflavin synthase